MEMLALVVDDEEQCVQTLLKGIDWKSVGIDRALGALSADEARVIIRKNPVALILCDIEMPGESGLEFIQWIRDDADLNGANMECIILV